MLYSGFGAGSSAVFARLGAEDIIECLRNIKERLKSPGNLSCCTQEMNVGS